MLRPFARLLPVLFATIFLLAPAMQARADVMEPRPEPIPPPHPVIQRDLTLTDMRVDIKLDGSVARTTIRQTLRNDNQWVAEGQYMLPLPPGASVSDFAIIDGDQRLTAKLLSADEARKTYEEIVRKMRDPGLLEYQDRSTYSVAVFPFQPGQSRTIEVSFGQALAGTTDMLSYQLPLRWAGWSRLGEYGGGAKLTLIYDVRGDFPLGVVSSPTYGVSVNRDGDKHASGSYEGTVTHFSSDFSLNVGRRTGDFAATLACYPGDSGEDGYFLLSLLAALPKDEKYVPKDVLFIFDKSGSMEGEKIEQARGALRFVLGQLKSEDRFNVLYYSDAVSQVFDKLRGADSSAVQEARDAVSRLTADGGTDINSALTQGAQMLSGSKGSTRPTYAIFLTDGLPTVGDTDVNNILAGAKQNFGKDVKLFVFGVGYDVNTTLLDTLSLDHHGNATYVSENEDIEAKVSQFYGRIASPALTSIQLTVAGLDAYDQMPRELPDLFHNSEVFITGRYRGSAPASSTVTVKGNGLAGQQTLQANITPNVHKSNNSVPRLWATRKVSWLIDQVRLKGDNKELLGEIDRLATRFGIVTPYTSYLITEPKMTFATPAERMADLQGNVEDARKDESGEKAVGRSKMNQANQSSQVAAAPQSAGGMAGGGGAPPEAEPMALPGQDAPDWDKKQEVLRRSGQADTNSSLNYVNEQTFVRQDDDQQRVQWVDARFDKAKQQTVRIQTYSDAYFELLAQHPELGDYLAQGESVVLVLANGVVLETTPDEVQLSDADLGKLKAALKEL